MKNDSISEIVESVLKNVNNEDKGISLIFFLCSYVIYGISTLYYNSE